MAGIKAVVTEILVGPGAGSFRRVHWRRSKLQNCGIGGTDNYTIQHSYIEK